MGNESQKADCESNKILSSFLIPYFTSLRDEINQRVKQHSYLVIYKIVTIGAIFAFLIKASDMSIKDFGKNLNGYQYLFWIVPLIGIVFDMLILGNLRVVFNIGMYIKNEYEEKLFRKWKDKSKDYYAGIEFWESVGAHKKAKEANLNKGNSSTFKWQCYTKFDMTIIYSITAFSVLLLLIMLPCRYNVIFGIITLFVSLIVYFDMLLLVSGKEPSITSFIKNLFRNEKAGKEDDNPEGNA
jgi:ABC-type multidrug transport system fused ATPase/permease subunit